MFTPARRRLLFRSARREADLPHPADAVEKVGL
jgi:hypothetical protein